MPDSPAAESHPDPTLGALYRHIKRPGWGIGLCAECTGNTPRFQFQDGQLRTISRPFLHMLELVDMPANETERAMSELRAMTGVSVVCESPSHPKGGRPLTFEQQISIFTYQYPGGFADPRWRLEMRGEGAVRRIKRHRAPAIAEAQELLSEQTLRSLIAQREHSRVLEQVARVFQHSSLVTGKQLEPLTDLPVDARDKTAENLVELLYGQKRHELLLFGFVQGLRTAGRTVDWQLATALPALVHPGEHVYVHPVSFQTQARWIAPRLQVTASCNERQYKRLLRVAEMIRTKLVEWKLAPEDLLDVYDFMLCTLRPAARKLLARITKEGLESF